MLQHVAACCMLQRAIACCTVLQRVAVSENYSEDLQYDATSVRRKSVKRCNKF